jgi:uncharacterized repeat protein (TIGR03803 family)
MSNYTTVTYPYTFAGSTDGSDPQSSLALGTDGNLYGTASAGGVNGAGSIFKLTTGGTLTILYTFTGGADGKEPLAGLIQGSDGNFYGTTTSGGAYGYGTLYNLTTNGLLTTLASFNYTNGAVPFGTLVQASDGIYYGTTSQGGTNGDGTIFAWSATNGLTTLHTFAGTDGDFPGAGLIQGTDGNLYGTTEADGLGGQGTVFLITTNGALTTLVWFDGFNGAEPLSTLVQATDGNFYGTAAFGGTGYDFTSGGGNGTLYKVTDPTGPAITVPSTITVAATNAGGNVVNFTVTATDATDGSLTPIVTPPSGSTFPIGTNLVTATVTDSLNLSATNTFLVIVTDVPPVIVSEPVSVTNYAGSTASFTVGATAFTPLSYLWYFGTNALVGETNSTLTLPSVTPAEAGSYEVTVSCEGGSTNSIPATLTVIYQAPNLFAAPLLLNSNGFQFSFSGPAGQTYKVLSSDIVTNPVADWTVVTTGTFGGGTVVFTDPGASTNTISEYYIIESP